MDVMKTDERAEFPPEAEWLEADGRGGFASGTVSGLRTRRYHALLLSATTPPTGRVALVNGVEAWVDTPEGTIPLTSQRYVPDVVHPETGGRLRAFSPDPWPRWRYELPGGTTLEHEVLVPSGFPMTVLTWTASQRKGAGVLWVRPLLSCRDMHALQAENPDFRFEADVDRDAGGPRVYWRPYPGLPEILGWANGDYVQAPHWYRNFLYTEERARGLDFVEDLGSPGVFRFDLSRGEAVLLLAAVDIESETMTRQTTAADTARRLRTAERARRRRFPTRLHRAADAYLVRRGEGRTVIAGYPWFTDWGRDTFVSLRGLCLATGRFKEARDVLVTWADLVRDGLLPNCYGEDGTPSFNAVDAPLWFALAVGEYVEALSAQGKKVTARDRARLAATVESILDTYANGTRSGIRLDDDALLTAGEPGLQLTWMDAKTDGRVITRRAGKPVEVQALWLNALAVGASLTAKRTAKRRWQELFDRGLDAFRVRFWSEADGYLYDVVDVDETPGEVDASFRPNQIFAVGGLPIALLDGKRARQVVDAVEARLLTPLGLRTLAPGEPGYAPRYQGDAVGRDEAYHQGTVWPWLLGPFVEAWLRTRGETAAARREARECFLEPLLARADEYGIGHLPEVADAEPPHAPHGCPFQAWSVAEALRLSAMLPAEEAAPRASTRKTTAQRNGRARGGKLVGASKR